MKKITLKNSLSLLMMLATIQFCSGQSYNTVLGMRFGEDFGFVGAQRIANHTTLELSASDGLFSSNKFVSATLKQHHNLVTRRFNFFVGGGYIGKSLVGVDNERENYSTTGHGIAGVMGTEFTLGRLNFSLDYVPQYILTKEFSGRRLTADSALSIRYVMWKRKGWLKKFFGKIF
ncbi:MAG: hypothetical protein IPN29_19495 [Saprospiraceae bacterium]|nr:hypothetical protein [Saprospiraceae bacterium]